MVRSIRLARFRRFSLIEVGYDWGLHVLKTSGKTPFGVEKTEVRGEAPGTWKWSIEGLVALPGVPNRKPVTVG
jgi:hypothetical protein